ncbi:MAG: PAS domain S-box protein [Candidatus Ozemobacteraceae bacterium]
MRRLRWESSSRKRRNLLFQQRASALREDEEKFRIMVEKLPQPLYMSVGPEQKCVYLNPAFTQLFGYTMEEVPTVEQWWPLAYPDEAYRRQISEEWTARVKHAIETKSSIEPMEVTVTCKDGSKKFVSWYYVSIGEKNYAYAIDLTKRKQAEDEKDQLQGQLNQSRKM